MAGTERQRNDRLDLYIQGVLTDAELPMFSKLLVELLALPIDDPKAARKLFELVAEDYALTCKVLRTANSFHFNRSNRPIENLSQAIFVLGVGTVRNLASTLVCFQSSQPRPMGLQHLMTRSMVSAQVAGITAELDGIEREAAYLAGMLQNLGEVLVAHHSPAHHLAIQKQVAEGTARDFACIAEMGFTYDHLARLVAGQWKLSPAICAVWEPRVGASELAAFARFANELTSVMSLDANAHRTGALALISMRYSLTVHLNAEDMLNVWEQGLSETQEMFKTLGVPFDLPSPPEPEAVSSAS